MSEESRFAGRARNVEMERYLKPKHEADTRNMTLIVDANNVLAVTRNDGRDSSLRSE